MKWCWLILVTVSAVLIPLPAAATECEKLPPLICLTSVRCTLDCERVPGDRRRCAPEAGYKCRPENIPCEQATDQTKLTRAECERDSRCTFEAAYCFCGCALDGGCNCACGGGPPNGCIEKEL